MTTIHTPAGSKVRSASQRRFIVIVEELDRATGKPNRAHIARRSDSVDTARQFASRQGPVSFTADTKTTWTVFDQRTGQEVKD